MLKRRGASLVELLVAMSLAAVLLGAASTSLVRQRQDRDGAESRAGTEAQLRAALAEVPSALQGLSPSAGDLKSGEARDTALQIRAVVALGVACDSAVGQVILSASDTGAERESLVATTPHVGDTLWWWPPGGASWTARRVTSVVAGSGVCASEAVASRPILRLGLQTPDSVPRAAIIRLTRQTRYSFYRAGDGSWQLGIAEWSDVLHDFAPPQPVAGPFLLAASDGMRTGFRYFDAAGTELFAAGQGVPVGSVARLRVTVIASGTSLTATSLTQRDSVDVAFGHVP